MALSAQRVSAGKLARRLFCGLTLCLCLLTSALAMAKATSDPTPLHFRSTAEETRFQALTAELRCVQCQNQSLADSNASIAHDLRREVLVLMHAGRSDEQIKNFLVERYGDFVLYRPALAGKTIMLWLAPLVVLVAGAWALIGIIGRRAAQLDANDDAQAPR